MYARVKTDLLTVCVCNCVFILICAGTQLILLELACIILADYRSTVSQTFCKISPFLPQFSFVFCLFIYILLQRMNEDPDSHWLNNKHLQKFFKTFAGK